MSQLTNKEKKELLSVICDTQDEQINKINKLIEYYTKLCDEYDDALCKYGSESSVCIDTDIKINTADEIFTILNIDEKFNAMMTYNGERMPRWRSPMVIKQKEQ